MRHKIGYRKLNRTSEHRKALFKNLLNSLIKYEQIKTTLPKAKELKPQIDKVITLGKKNNLQSKKNLFDELQSKLNKSGIGANVYYKTPIHKMTFYKKFNNKKINKTNSEWASKHVLSLPIHPKISHTQMEFIGRTFVKCIGK